MDHLKPVKRSKKFDGLVEALAKTDENRPKLFETIRELVVFAAMLGFAEGKRVKLSSAHKTEDISYQQFEFNNSNDFIYLIAVGETETTDVLKQESEIDIVLIFEEYANGGLETIAAWMSEFADENGHRALIQGLIKNDYLEVGGDETITIEDIKNAVQF